MWTKSYHVFKGEKAVGRFFCFTDSRVQYPLNKQKTASRKKSSPMDGSDGHIL